MQSGSIRNFLLASTCIALGLWPLTAAAQQAADATSGPQSAPDAGPQSAPEQSAPETTESNSLDRVVIVGSQIAGAETTGALPVTVVGIEEIEATGAVSAEELFRTVPQAGDITFNGTYLGGGNSNAARGDVSTVSLRGLAQGNTLMLLNGRRSVLHPTSQTDNQTPVFGYNVNAVPVQGLARVEVLKDGAAALYGSDAVAGVVNNVLQDDFEGLNVSLQYGFAEDTNVREFTGSVLYGTEFAEGRGNISLFLGATDRSSLLASDQDYTDHADRRNFVAGTPWGSPAVVFDARATGSPWGVFTPVSGTAPAGGIRRNGVLFTDATGAFHSQPTSGFGNAATCTPSGYTSVCFAPGAVTAASYREMRYDSPNTFKDLTTLPGVERYNAFAFANYDLTENLRVYGEAGYYQAQTESVIGSGGSLGSAPITIAANAYWNPLGSGPNRLSGLNSSAAGVPIVITSYNLVDAGTRDVVVDNDQFRVLAGLKGDFWGWDWDSAVLYSEAEVHDEADGYSSTLFQQALNRTDNTAYNPFSGGNPATPSIGDSTGNLQATIDSFRIKQVRENRTSLLLGDLKVSKPDLLTYWAGDIGVAAGVEWRREMYWDDRDARQDTSTPFYNQITGALVSTSDLMGHSPSPDVKGARNTASAYIEFAIPLVSPDWNIPLVEAVDLQLAGRYEDYSDVGSVAKPKIAMSWDVAAGLKLRGSWSEGFKAPNLEVVNTPMLERVNGYPDYIQCEAALRQRGVPYSQCAYRSVTVASLRSGNANLVPEESTSYSYGAVFEPTFLPESLGSLTLTVDSWHIEQENVIGLLTDDTALTYDYFLRLSGGSNPLVIRKAPTPQQIAEFAGTGLTPVGDVLNVIAAFTNLAPLEVEGVDYGLFWDVDAGPGTFRLNLNASNLTTYYQSPTAEAAILLAAKAAGTINPGVAITGGGNLIEQGGRPQWKGSMSLSYAVENWEIGTFTQYTGLVYQPTVLGTGNVPWKVGDQYTTNAYVQYKFDKGVMGDGSIRVGVRNITNEDPPFASGDTGGWLSSLYQPVPRYWYFDLKKSF
ncbi:MAG: TonB-dependent receptor [Hyphomonadaceae bacterium]|nr:TonB-dependent receptor [Hyphomonadaceae bacterium]